MQQSAASTLANFRKNKKPIRNVNAEQKNRQTSLDKIAVFITNRIGTMGFFIVIFCWTAFWLSWNMLADKELRFDPMPGFVLWLFISNMILLFLMPLIMVGQNVQGKHAEARAEADFEINTKAENEIEALLLLLEEQDKKLETILRRLPPESK